MQLQSVGAPSPSRGRTSANDATVPSIVPSGTSLWYPTAPKGTYPSVLTLFRLIKEWTFLGNISIADLI